ncbi:MAG: penicillin-binding protein 2 [Patescibacteria group bacterium]|nr:penicillin-binding protein 2 [Patescibacteria group bacterium]
MKTKYFINRKDNNETELEEIFAGPMQEEVNKVENLINKKNIKITEAIFFAILFALFLQAAYLQIIKGDYYAKKSERNYTRTTAVKSPRGIIYDRNQNQIVFNVPVFDLVIIPYDFFKEKDKISEKISNLSKVINSNKNDFDKKIKGIEPSSYQPFLILENIDKEDALIFEEKIKDIDGVELEKSSIRNYIDGNYFSNIVGYNGRINENELKKHSDYLPNDMIGKNGLELIYEKQLRGKYGKQEIEVDSFGRKIKIIERENCEPGNNLVLNIDAGLQKKIYDELIIITEKLETKNGAAVVAINPKNGAVLALVSFPSYNNNLFAGGISDSDYYRLLSDEMKPLFNKAVSGEYPPGSTIKPLIGAAALQENIISPSRIIVGGEAIYIGSYRFLDWKAHGSVNLVKAIAQSCNIYFYTVGGGYGGIEGLGIKRIKNYANLFGLGNTLGIDIPEEGAGLVPDKEWKKNVKNEKWYIGDTYHVSIGQGDILTTPLQVAVYTAAIANGGKLFQPQVVNKIIDLNSEVVEDLEPKIIRENFIDLENIKWIQKGMRENVISGSGRALANLAVEVAGKTGTAQYARNKKTHAWYTAYAPYDDPEIALAVLIEGGGEGHAAAVPVAREVLGWYFGEDKNLE